MILKNKSSNTKLKTSNNKMSDILVRLGYKNNTDKTEDYNKTEIGEQDRRSTGRPPKV